MATVVREEKEARGSAQWAAANETQPGEIQQLLKLAQGTGGLVYWLTRGQPAPDAVFGRSASSPTRWGR
jgi:hypothetical protein